MSYEITIHPRDVLFFRDARPMGGSHEGSGAAWPLATTFHAALQSALYARWPDRNPEWESHHRHFSDKEQHRGRHLTSQMRFGGLKTSGPFPCTDGHVFFPTPTDLQPDGNLLAPVKAACESHTNLPLPLQYAVGGTAQPTKKKLDPWISDAELAKYLSGSQDITTTSASQLYSTETRPGVGIDPETGAHVPHVFHQAQYLRLHEDAHMVAFVDCLSRKADGTETDLLAKVFAETQSLPFVFGGQQGVAYMRGARAEAGRVVWRNLTTPSDTLHIKWVLLAPAVFNAGWRPDWVAADGQVLLKDAPERTQFTSRAEWRKAINDAAAAIAGVKLVAARIPGAIPFSGWQRNMAGEATDKELGPRRTLLAVPAGSVYYFKADNSTAAQALCRQLHGRVKSSWYGERGFGLGVCGKWDFMTDNVTNKETAHAQ